MLFASRRETYVKSVNYNQSLSSSLTINIDLSKYHNNDIKKVYSLKIISGKPLNYYVQNIKVHIS